MLGFVDSFKVLFFSRKADIILYPSVEFAAITLNLSAGRLGRFLVVAPVDGLVTVRVGVCSIVGVDVDAASFLAFFFLFLLSSTVCQLPESSEELSEGLFRSLVSGSMLVSIAEVGAGEPGEGSIGRVKRGGRATAI